MLCTGVLGVTEKYSEYQFLIFKFQLWLLFGKLDDPYTFNMLQVSDLSGADTLGRQVTSVGMEADVSPTRLT